MKSFNETKRVLGFYQTDVFFLEYLQKLNNAGVIAIQTGNIREADKMVSDDFYDRLRMVFGVSLADELQQ